MPKFERFEWDDPESNIVLTEIQEIEQEYNRGISVSHCDYIELDHESQVIRFVEETQWWDDQAIGEQGKYENTKKFLGSLHLFTLMVMAGHYQLNWLKEYKREFVIKSVIDAEFRMTVLVRELESDLKQLKNGLIDKIKIESA